MWIGLLNHNPAFTCMNDDCALSEFVVWNDGTQYIPGANPQVALFWFLNPGFVFGAMTTNGPLLFFGQPGGTVQKSFCEMECSPKCGQAPTPAAGVTISEPWLPYWARPGKVIS